MKELATGLAAIGLAIVYLAASRMIASSPLDDPVTARGFPTMLGAGMLALGLAMAWRGAMVLRAERGAPSLRDQNPGASPARAFALPFIATIYAFAAPVIGYIGGIAGAAFLAAWVFGARPRLPLAGFAIGLGIVLWCLFVLLADTPQPEASLLRRL